MATYTIYRETATNEGLVTEGTTFSGTPDGLRNHAYKLMAEGNDRTKLRITVVAFCKLKTKVVVLTRRHNAIVPPNKDILGSLPTEEEYAAKATRLESVLVRPSIDELLES
jgi:hypothetical protein